MNSSATNLPVDLISAHPLGGHLNKLKRAVQAATVLNTPDMRIERTPAGIKLHPRIPNAPPIPANPFAITKIGQAGNLATYRVGPGWLEVQRRFGASDGSAPNDGQQEQDFWNLVQFPGTGPATGVPDLTMDLNQVPPQPKFVTLFVSEKKTAPGGITFSFTGNLQPDSGGAGSLTRWYWGLPLFPVTGPATQWTEERLIGMINGDGSIVQIVRDHIYGQFTARPLRGLGLWDPAVVYYENELVQLGDTYTFDPAGGSGPLNVVVQSTRLAFAGDYFEEVGQISFNNKPSKDNQGAWIPVQQYTSATGGA